jgi:ABC-2 type transport system permease protein
VSVATPTVALPSPGGERGLGQVPGTWDQAVRMSRYQFRDYLRSRRFVLMLAIVAAISAILLSLVAYYRPVALISTSGAFFGSLWVGGAEILIIFAAIIFGGDAIAGEFQNRTGYFLMGLPVKRWSVYAGKYLAAFAASLLTIGIYFVVLVGAGLYFVGPGAITGGLFESLAVAALYLGAVLGTTFLFSSLFKTSMYGVIIVAIMFLFGFSVIEGVIEGLVHITPWFIITWANATISYPITGLPAGAGHEIDSIIVSPTYAQGLAVMAAYFIGTTFAGLAFFEKEEFT